MSDVSTGPVTGPVTVTAVVVADLIELTTGIVAGEIGPETRFESMGNWTSLAALGLLARVEEHFGVKLDLRAYFGAARVDELVSLVCAAQADPGPHSR